MNEQQIRYSFELMKQDNELVEIRIIGSNGKTYSGYFKDIDLLVKEVSRFDNENIYFVLNKIKDACYSREQCNKIIEKPKATTTDNDIEKRDWLLIDIDPKRPTGVGANDTEKQTSKQTANLVYVYLRDLGFSSPIVCDSGNGSHLLYKINLPNNEETKLLMQSCLQILDFYFSSDEAEIDRSVFNASRITKLYGTTARKGKSTEDRPHRESKIIKVPEQIKETPKELLQLLASKLPIPEKKTYSNNYGNEEFDLRYFIQKNGIKVTSEQSFSGGTKFILDECVFDANHKGKDAAIFQLSNGAIGYKCLHNSCSHYRWQDVRKLFEPNAYERTQREFSTQRDIKPIKKPQAETKEQGCKFLQMHEIENFDRSKIVAIPSGFIELDKKIIGFNKGEVSLWSGKNGSAKSTILNQVLLNAINAGFRGTLYSGELSKNRIKNWTHLQCAGRQFTRPSQYENLYFVPQITGTLIDEWLKNKLYIYNNDYGNGLKQLLIDIEEHQKVNKCDVIVLDNVMSLDLEEYSGDKYEAQKKAILRICDFARKEDIHIHIVAHPRKSVTFLRKEDISGTADLTNRVDNVFITHRVNNDFNRAVSDFFGKEYACNFLDFTNVIEVCKHRDLGIQDLLIGFYFEVESKRLLNYRHENIVYGWQEQQEQSEININHTVEMEKDCPF